MPRLLAAPIALTLMCSAANAQEHVNLDRFEGRSIGSSEVRCDPDGSQVELSICASLYAQDADRQLDALVARMTAQARQEPRPANTSEGMDYIGSISRANDAWKTWRESECALATIDSMSGSVRPIEYSVCYAELTNARRLQLEAALEHWNAGFQRDGRWAPLICVMYPDLSFCAGRRARSE